MHHRRLLEVLYLFALDREFIIAIKMVTYLPLIFNSFAIESSLYVLGSLECYL